MKIKISKHEIPSLLGVQTALQAVVDELAVNEGVDVRTLKVLAYDTGMMKVDPDTWGLASDVKQSFQAYRKSQERPIGFLAVWTPVNLDISVSQVIPVFVEEGELKLRISSKETIGAALPDLVGEDQPALLIEALRSSLGDRTELATLVNRAYESVYSYDLLGKIRRWLPDTEVSLVEKGGESRLCFVRRDVFVTGSAGFGAEPAVWVDGQRLLWWDLDDLTPNGPWQVDLAVLASLRAALGLRPLRENLGPVSLWCPLAAIEP